MKKIFLFITTLFLILLSSCVEEEKTTLKLICPSGAPIAAISNFLVENDNIEYDITSGSDGLISAFTNGTYDIIVAPTNLGVKMYNTNSLYKYVSTIIWGNVYICSTEKIESFTDLDGKTITAFGENNTPGLLLKSLINYYQIDVNVTYLTDVSSVNPLFLSGQSNIILSAEPQVSVLESKKTFYKLDVQQIFEEVFQSKIPQSSIFIRKDSINKQTENIINDFKNSINDLKNNSKSILNIKSVEENFKKIDDNILLKGLLNSNIYTIDYSIDKSYLQSYLQIISNIGLAKLFGGKIPDEEFYF